MEKVIVLGHGKPYDFKNDGGEQVKGVKISYINSSASSQVGVKGYLPLQVSLDPVVLDSLKDLPGIYEVKYIMKPGKNNKPEATIDSFSFIKTFDIQKLL